MVRTKKNTIILNGKVYDAVTGKPLSSSESTTERRAKTVSLHNPPIVTPTVQPTSVSHKTAPKKKAVSTKITVVHSSVRTDSHTVHVRTDRSHTLRRTGLKKPAVRKIQSPQTTHAVAGLTTQPKHRVIGTASPSTTAQAVHRSPKISKFAAHKTVSHRTEVVPVKNEPQKASPKNKAYSIHNTPPAPRVVKTTPSPTTGNILENALAVATSHHAPAPTRPQKKRGSFNPIGIVILSSLFIFSVVMHSNAPRIALLKARARIGFSASLPKYQPSGFGLSGGVQYQAGLVMAHFRSNSDDRLYTVTQTTANTDNYSLAQELKQKGQSFSTEVVNGYRVYITSNGATWVLHGVRYSIEGNAGLNTEQLTRIASSI